MWKTPEDNYLYVGENGFVNLYTLTSTGLEVTWELEVDSNGNIKDKVNIEAELISKSAKEKLEKNGGSIQIRKINKDK